MPFSRLTAVAGVLAGPGQASSTTQAAVPASMTAQAARRASSASRAISRTPPARHASRARPLGACPASAHSALAQSRRWAGISRRTTRARRRFMTDQARWLRACPGRPARAAGRPDRGGGGGPGPPGGGGLRGGLCGGCFRGGGQRGRRAGQAVRGQPVQVPARPPGHRLVLPARLDQAPLGQPDQDRVERAGLQAGLAGQRVPVPPLRRLRRQRGQHRQRLNGELSPGRHAGDSIYVDRAMST
jgi:hypothetical protein